MEVTATESLDGLIRLSFPTVASDKAYHGRGKQHTSVRNHPSISQQLGKGSI